MPAPAVNSRSSGGKASSQTKLSSWHRTVAGEQSGKVAGRIPRMPVEEIHVPEPKPMRVPAGAKVETSMVRTALHFSGVHS